MKRKLKVIAAFVVGIGAGVVAGCQSYDFEPVKPLAISQTTEPHSVHARDSRPNIMIVVDQSGSMDFPINPSDPNCQSGGVLCGPPNSCPAPGTCPNTCKTRISELQNAMGTFLGQNPTIARFGLLTFPTGSATCYCGAPDVYSDGGISGVEVPIPQTNDDLAVLQNTSNAIVSQINAIVPTGGTPTGATLAALGQYANLLDTNRTNIVLLLTDGEPNCNFTNPHSCGNCNPSSPAPYCQTPADVNSCRQCSCTLDCPSGTSDRCACPGPNCQCVNGTVPPYQTQFGTLGCLDKDGTVGQIQLLRAKGISTIPVGFGAETVDGGAGTGQAPAALNAMAIAGGYPRACDGGVGSCGPVDTCNGATGICNRAYYQASTASQLVQVLDEIRGRIPPGICEYQLTTAPSDPRLLAVRVNGTPVPAGPNTWTYVPGQPPEVIFADNGTVCTQLKNATSTNPVLVEILIVNPQ
jgi:hypothetical protein